MTTVLTPIFVFRNLFAEKAVTFMSIPCEFKTYGCSVEIQYKDKEAHEKVCKYRPYICPYIECDHKLAAGPWWTTSAPPTGRSAGGLTGRRSRPA